MSPTKSTAAAPDMAIFQARLNAALALAASARTAVRDAPAQERTIAAPFLDHCAGELERAASALRAAAEDALAPQGPQSCSQ